MTASGSDESPAGRSPVLAAALRLLNRRDYATGELRQRLLDKGYPADAVAAAVGRVAALGYLDDVRFATLMSESSFRNKGWGPSRIERALLRRGIDPETAAAAVASYRDVETEASRATEVLRRRVRNAGEIGDASALRRSRQYLLRRGFSPGAVTAALRELKREVLA